MLKVTKSKITKNVNYIHKNFSVFSENDLTYYLEILGELKIKLDKESKDLFCQLAISKDFSQSDYELETERLETYEHKLNKTIHNLKTNLASMSINTLNINASPERELNQSSKACQNRANLPTLGNWRRTVMRKNAPCPRRRKKRYARPNRA